MRDDLAAPFPPANVSILADLTCRPDQLRVAGAQARLGHYGEISRGRAWFDDLRLEAVP